MKLLRSIFNWHEHYWGRPHGSPWGTLIMTCYGCSRTREVNVKNIGYVAYIQEENTL